MDEDFFQSMLEDTTADDPQLATRLLFSEWLAERGDLRAAGYRWMAIYRKAPLPNRGCSAFREEFGQEFSWDWTAHITGSNAIGDNLRRHMSKVNIPHQRYGAFVSSCDYLEYRSRRDAEEALCQVIQERNT